MNCSVNLVPQVLWHARIRRARQVRWTWVCAGLAVLVVIGVTLQQASLRARYSLATRVQLRESERSELQRQLAAADAQRTALVLQLESIASVRHPQPWAQRLAALSQSAPDGVFLTALQIAPASASDPQKPRPANASRTGPHNEPTTRPGARFAQSVRLRGYALDHNALIQLMAAVQELPGWRQVELVRAATEPFRTDSAVAFELYCELQEVQP